MKTLIVPTHLNEIPLFQMVEYNALQESDIKELQAISIFCNLSISEVKAMPFHVITKASKHIANLLSEQPKFQNKFTHKGIQYGFIPNLNDISGAEVIDIDNYQKNPLDLYKCISVLYRPITHEGQNGRYEIEKYKGKVNEDFRDVPSDIAFGAMVFFWTLGKDLMNFTRRYLTDQAKVQLTNMGSIKSGDGLALYTSLLEEMSQNFKKWSECPFTPYVCGHLTKQTLQNLNDTN